MTTDEYQSKKKENTFWGIFSLICAITCFILAVIYDGGEIAIGGLIFLFVTIGCYISTCSAKDKCEQWEKERYEQAEQDRKERREYEKQLAIYEAANDSIEECICDNIFKMGTRKKGYRTYTDRIAGVYYTNIRLEKVLDCYLKLESSQYDDKGIAIYSMNDVRLGWMPKESLLKQKLSRVLKEDDRFEGYASLNPNGRYMDSYFKFQLPNELMGC